VAYQVPVCVGSSDFNQTDMRTHARTHTHRVDHLYAQLVADPLEHNYGGSQTVSIYYLASSRIHIKAGYITEIWEYQEMKFFLLIMPF
jgi:hypothetical protein